jgi:hypothetical protein
VGLLASSTHAWDPDIREYGGEQCGFADRVDSVYINNVGGAIRDQVIIQNFLLFKVLSLL